MGHCSMGPLFYCFIQNFIFKCIPIYVFVYQSISKYQDKPITNSIPHLVLGKKHTRIKYLRAWSHHHLGWSSWDTRPSVFWEPFCMGAQVDVETPPRYQLLCCGLSVNNDLFTPVSVHNKFQILCINGNFHFRKNFVSFYYSIFAKIFDVQFA